MSEQNGNGKLSAESQQTLMPPADVMSDPAATSDEKDQPIEADAPKKLTAEEQMALYEKALKEDDWGHQPC